MKKRFVTKIPAATGSPAIRFEHNGAGAVTIQADMPAAYPPAAAVHFVTNSGAATW